MSSGDAGLMTIRVWMEGEPPSIRIRITRALDVDQPERVESVTSDPAQASAELLTWLRDFERTARSTSGQESDHPVLPTERE